MSAMESVDPVIHLFAQGDGKFEWVRGHIIAHPPVGVEECDLTSFLTSILSIFAEERSGGRVLGSRYLHRLANDLIRAPDIAYVAPDRLDRVRPTHFEGAADLVIEVVSKESRLRDRGEKFFEYEAAAIEHCWFLDPERQRAEFYRLRDRTYVPYFPDAQGIFRSSPLPNFFLDIAWLWNRPKLSLACRALGILS